MNLDILPMWEMLSLSIYINYGFSCCKLNIQSKLMYNLLTLTMFPLTWGGLHDSNFCSVTNPQLLSNKFK